MCHCKPRFGTNWQLYNRKALRGEDNLTRILFFQKAQYLFLRCLLLNTVVNQWSFPHIMFIHRAFCTCQGLRSNDLTCEANHRRVLLYKTYLKNNSSPSMNISTSHVHRFLTSRRNDTSSDPVVNHLSKSIVKNCFLQEPAGFQDCVMMVLTKPVFRSRISKSLKINHGNCYVLNSELFTSFLRSR